MKKALIIIGAVFAGLALLAIVGAAIGEDEPQKVVIVTETETPAAEPVETPSLTADEQEVYDFIAESYPKAQELFENTCAVTDKESTDDGLADIATIIEDAGAFVKIAKPWAELDWANGEVTDLETAFGEYMVAVRVYYKNWLNGIDGGNVAACATRAVKAEVKAEKWAPRVEDELAAVEDLASY